VLRYEVLRSPGASGIHKCSDFKADTRIKNYHLIVAEFVGGCKIFQLTNTPCRGQSFIALVPAVGELARLVQMAPHAVPQVVVHFAFQVHVLQNFVNIFLLKYVCLMSLHFNKNR
jgi:hypothetical protein